MTIDLRATTGPSPAARLTVGGSGGDRRAPGDGGGGSGGGADGRAWVVEPLLGAVAAEQVLACAVDLAPGARSDAVPAGARTTTPDAIGAALAEQPALVLVHGNLSWHAIRVLTPALTAGAGRPILVFESGPPDPVPTWATLESRTAQGRRVEAVIQGTFSGVDALAAALGDDATVLRCGAGRAAAAIVPTSAPEAVRSWLAATAPFLGAYERQRRRSFEAQSRAEDLAAELHHVDLLVGEVLGSPRWLGPDFVRVFRALERRSILTSASAAVGRLATAVSGGADPETGPVPAGDRRWTRGRTGHRINVASVRLKRLGRIGRVSLVRGPHIELARRAEAAAQAEERSPAPLPARSTSGAPGRAADQSVASDRPEGPLRITYVLPILRIAGGILGVTQLANELRLLGADTRIVAAEDRAEVYRWRFLAPPTVFDGSDELIAGTEATDVVVATHWSTVAWADEIVRAGRARTAAYFLQDYEAWFYPDDPDLQAAVRSTYDVIEAKIVKSDWLAGLVAGDGHATHKIVLGYDLGFFHPRPVERPDHPVILAMARPRTPRRGFATLVAALDLVHREVPDAEIVLFGSDLELVDLPFPCRRVGMVTDQEQLARLYSGAHVHIDASDFQAFGRPALEAMGCGAASVLTDVGGVSEYARHERNCLLVPPGEPEPMAAAVVRLCRDPELRDRIRHAGFDTVIRYSMKQEARSTLALFEQLVASAPALQGGDPVGHGPAQVDQVGRQQG